MRVPLRDTPSQKTPQTPTLPTQIEGSYAYNEFQFQKKELYLYDIFDMQKKTRKWLKESLLLRSTPLYATLQSLSNEPKRNIKKQDIPALATMRNTFIQVSE